MLKIFLNFSEVKKSLKKQGISCWNFQFSLHFAREYGKMSK